MKSFSRSTLQLISALIFCLLLANFIATAHNHKSSEPETDNCFACQHFQHLTKTTLSNSVNLTVSKTTPETIHYVSISSPFVIRASFQPRAPPV